MTKILIAYYLGGFTCFMLNMLALDELTFRNASITQKMLWRLGFASTWPYWTIRNFFMGNNNE